MRPASSASRLLHCHQSSHTSPNRQHRFPQCSCPCNRWPPRPRQASPRVHSNRSHRSVCSSSCSRRPPKRRLCHVVPPTNRRRSNISSSSSITRRMFMSTRRSSRPQTTDHLYIYSINQSKFNSAYCILLSPIYILSIYSSAFFPCCFQVFDFYVSF